MTNPEQTSAVIDDFKKSARELPFLGFMFEMPIVVAGVGVAD